MSLISELKRRNVFKVGVAYVIVSWLLIQVTDIAAPALHLPEWTVTLIIYLLIIGLPLALFLAWAFELTPEGIKVTSSEGPDQFHTQTTGQQLNYTIIGVLILAVIFLVIDNYVLDDREERQVKSEEDDTSAVVQQSEESTPTQSGQSITVLPNSVAVLPFASLSLDPENAFFAAGIHDELLNQLAKIRDINVIARTSVLRYAQTDKSIREIAKELNVGTIMEGTIRYGSNRIRLTAQLIDPETGTHLWSNTFDRKFEAENVFEIESDIAIAIASALQAELTVAEQEAIAMPLTKSTEAWALYLRAMSLIFVNMNPWESVETVTKFHELLDQALAIDPDFATAHAVKAVQYAFTIGSPKLKSDPRTAAHYEQLATESAERALALDPGNGLAYMAIALSHWDARRVASALRAFEKALELDPNNLEILDDFSRLNAALGRKEEAIRLTRRVVELDPNNPSLLGWTLFTVGDLDAAADAYYQAMKIEPLVDYTAISIAHVEAARGNLDVAREYLKLSEKPELKSQWDLIQGYQMAARAYIYGRIGDAEDALRQYQQLQNEADKYRIPDSFWVIAELGIGNRAQALEHLRAAGDNPYLEITSDQIAGNWYQDPVLEQTGFVELRNRLGFLE